MTVDSAKTKQSWGVLFIGLSLFIGAACYAAISNYLKYRQIEPYTNVRILYQERKGDELFVTVSFTKTAGCHLVRYSVFGVTGPFALPLRYVDRDSVPAQYDRDPGKQILRNIILLRIADSGFRERFGLLDWDHVEVRTRHACRNLQKDESSGAEIVDRVFAVLDPDFVYLPPSPVPVNYSGIKANQTIQR